MSFLKQIWRDIKRVPAPTVFALIVFMAIIFLFEETTGADLRDLYAHPQRISKAWGHVTSGGASLGNANAIGTLFTAVFLHAGPDHILMNMVFLWTFASLASRMLGKWNVVWIFLLTGAVGNILQVCLVPNSIGAILGASGAVTGFQGVYVGLASRWRLNWPHVWPLAHPVSPMRLAVFALVGVGIDVYRLIQADGRIAFGAHIGGFICGFLIGIVFTCFKKNPDSRVAQRWMTS